MPWLQNWQQKLVVTSILTIFKMVMGTEGLPLWLSGKESTCQCRRCGIDPWVGKIPWRRKWHPLEYSCLGNPMDRGAWQATVRKVTKSRTWPSERAGREWNWHFVAENQGGNQRAFMEWLHGNPLRTMGVGSGLQAWVAPVPSGYPVAAFPIQE